MSDINKQIWEFLKSKGLTDYACAGVEGNLYCESGCRSNNLQNTYEKSLGMSDEEYTRKVDSGEYTNFVHDSAGYGLAQWTYWSRKQNLLQYAHNRDTSIGNLEMQLDFLWQEMPKSLIDALNSSKSVYDASTIFMCQFERPADQSDKAKKTRADVSQKFYDQFATGGNDDMNVTYSNSPLATDHVDLNKNSNPRNAYYSDTGKTYNPTGVIDKIALHHMAGKMTARACAEMHKRSTGASANYYIGYDGEICLGVDESRRAWTTGSRECDSYAVTIECSNSQNGEPWPVSDASYNSVIKLIADICKRNGIPRINYTGDKSGNLVMHKWYQNTACPGTYLAGRFEDIANKVNAILEGQPEPQPEPEPDTRTLYCVQVGVFANKENADNLCKQLESQGYKPFVVEKQVRG